MDNTDNVRSSATRTYCGEHRGIVCTETTQQPEGGLTFRSASLYTDMDTWTRKPSVGELCQWIDLCGTNLVTSCLATRKTYLRPLIVPLPPSLPLHKPCTPRIPACELRETESYWKIKEKLGGGAWGFVCAWGARPAGHNSSKGSPGH